MRSGKRKHEAELALSISDPGSAESNDSVKEVRRNQHDSHDICQPKGFTNLMARLASIAGWEEFTGCTCRVELVRTLPLRSHWSPINVNALEGDVQLLTPSISSSSYLAFNPSVRPSHCFWALPSLLLCTWRLSLPDSPLESFAKHRSRYIVILRSLFHYAFTQRRGSLCFSPSREDGSQPPF
jgi:hypothetical protein